MKLLGDVGSTLLLLAVWLASVSLFTRRILARPSWTVSVAAVLNLSGKRARRVLMLTLRDTAEASTKKAQRAASR